MSTHSDSHSSRGREDENVHVADHEASENTPLLGPSDGGVVAPDQSAPQSSSAESLLRSFQSKKKSGWRWPSIVALAILCVVVVLIIILGFIVPTAVEEYAMQAATFEPTGLSIDSFTSSGVKARVQGRFTMDGSKVKKKSTRDLGRFGTWIASEAETGRSEVEVMLPEYGNVIIGTAEVPRIKVNLREGHHTAIDFITELYPGDGDGLKKVARDWIDGRLGQLRVFGRASVPLKSGIFKLGSQRISRSIVFANKDIPEIPAYKIHKLNIHEAYSEGQRQGMAADVALEVENPYPVDVTVPPLGFDILVDNCSPGEPFIHMANATTHQLHVVPKENVNVTVAGLVRYLPDPLTQACPGSDDTPLDILLAKYISGNQTTIYVRGAESPSKDTPAWISELMSGITVPVPFPGHSFGHLIKNFSLADVHFGLPNPLADPDSDDSEPRITANVQAIIALPEEMNFNISVGRVRADADVYYHGSKLGKLDLSHWQKANSSRVASKKGEGPALLVESLVDNAPLRISDDDVFTEVIQALLFGQKPVLLTAKAEVDVEMKTALGELIVRKIPAEGVVPVKPINRGNDMKHDLDLKVGNLQVLGTTETSLTIEALVNLTNPTQYSATVPFADVHILSNGSLFGHATAQAISIKPGRNINIPITAVWNPLEMGGQVAHAKAVDFLSQWLSGFNTTLTLQTHNGSIPSQPALGHALSQFTFDLPTPSLGNQTPGDDDGNDDDDGDDDGDDGDNGAPRRKGPHFIRDATMHLISSTAQFTLASPLRTSTIYITHINATAFYKGDDVGHIDYDLPIAVPPGFVMTPRLPVDWSLGGVGYRAIRRALGGKLKLTAKADVGVRLGRWEERLWFLGNGIGANIRL